MWPSLLGAVSMCYSGMSDPFPSHLLPEFRCILVLSILAFMKQRRNFNALVSGRSQMNASRYARLMALAATDIALDLPLSIFLFWSNIHPGFQPWVSWSDTHYNFSLVS